MGSDMIVALKEASANGTTLFGLNHHAAAHMHHALHLVPGQMHDPGEVAPVSTIAVPQARQTIPSGHAADQPVGLPHGVNEHRLAWPHALAEPDQESCLWMGWSCGTLALGGHGIHHAVEVLTDLLERYAPAHSESERPSSDRRYQRGICSGTAGRCGPSGMQPRAS